MTICELINERNEVMRIEYWNDGKVRVIQSHGLSIMYGLKYSQIQKKFPYMSPIEVSNRTDRYMRSFNVFK